MADVNNLLPPPLSELVPIALNEYPNYFFLSYGRYFPTRRHPPALWNDPTVQLPCILPIDRHDMVRRTRQHNLVNLRLGHKNWFGPFERYMTQPGEKLVIDIGSNNGKWIEDVSDEFSHDAHFYGIEIFPSSPTEAANPNVVFEVRDFQRDGIPQAAASVDVVHACFQNFHIQDWDAFLNDVARCLKPGGLFMSGELDISLEYPETGATATIQLYNQVQRIMLERGYVPDIGTRMVDKLNTMTNSAGAPLFTNIDQMVYPLPMSANNGNNPNVTTEEREISILAKDYLDSLARSLRPFLLSTGQPEVEVDGLLGQHLTELRAITATMTYRCVWAERTSAV